MLHKTENFTYLCSMISLSRHIELLLLEHDCVIVPGLGGFIANHVEAQYDGEGDLLFLPPYRTIRFNQQLQVNDGLLVQSYMATYDASYPAAYLQMEKDIEKVIYELDTIGEYSFDKIGVLRKDINLGIAFTPSDTAVLTPSLYGLFSYEIKSLSSVIKEREVDEALNAASVMAVSPKGGLTSETEDEGAGKTIVHWHRRWIDIGISVAAAVVLLFCFSYQALTNTASDTDTVVAAFYTANDVEVDATVVDNKVSQTVQPVEEKENNEAKVEEETAPVEEESENNAVEKVVEEKAPAPADNVKNNAEEPMPKFAIVLASFVNKTNAEAFVEKLSNQGFKEARYVKNDNVSRILYSNYADREEAQQALYDLRKQSDVFESAWILEL